MRSTVRVSVLVVGASLALLAASAPAAGAPKRITGTLSEPGYTVVALSTGGATSVVRTRAGRFALRPPAERVTLHLRDRSGVYAGPIVLRSAARGRRAVVGVRAGARLGRIRVIAARGYARPVRRPRRRWIDTSLAARARRAVPIGAGNFGQVRSRPPGRRVRGDLDADGIPDQLDIDDDGDLRLDKQDRSRRARAAQEANDQLGLATGLGTPIERTANVHAGATDDQIDTAMRELGFIKVSIPFGIAAAELDCGAPVPAGRSYCAPGGSGVTEDRFLPFPSCCDGDGDGFGTMNPTDVVPGDFQNFGIDHRASTAEIGTGDWLYEHITLSGSESQCPPPGGSSPVCQTLESLQQYAFATVPALRSYDDGSGAVTIPYPVAPGGPGTRDNPFPVSARGGDVVLTATFWRPQRRPTSVAECVQASSTCTQSEWIDMGGLAYGVTADRDAACPTEAFSDPVGPLSAINIEGSDGGFVDDGGDRRPADAGYTFGYTVNLTRCLATKRLAFELGETREVRFNAFSASPSGVGGAGVDGAHQLVYFRRVQ